MSRDHTCLALSVTRALADQQAQVAARNGVGAA